MAVVKNTRIRGKQLLLKIGATDYWCDTTEAVLDSEEAKGGTVTFCDAAAGGGRQYFFKIEAIQSTDTASMWSYLWDHSGERVPFVYAPWGNAAPSVAQPHFTGFVTLGPRPAIGGKAGDDEFTFETRWDVDGVPVKVTT